MTGQAKAAGGTYDRMLQTILAYANGEGSPEECVQALAALLPHTGL